MTSSAHPGVVIVAFPGRGTPKFITANVEQAERLAARGLMVRSAAPSPSPVYEAVYAATDRAAVLAALREESDVAVCDFCNARPVTRSFPARSFMPGDPRLGRSLGGWAACSDCALLVARGDRAGLTRRAFEAVVREGAPGRSLPAIRRHLAELHEAFFANQLDPKGGVAVDAATDETGDER